MVSWESVCVTTLKKLINILGNKKCLYLKLEIHNTSNAELAYSFTYINILNIILYEIPTCNLYLYCILCTYTTYVVIT